MPSNLVIVESPAKAKTIKKYLGPDFEVLASFGHVRDLRPKEGAVDPAQNFQMNYEIIERNSKHVDAIIKALKKADTLYLATDPDREGEAISWHLVELLKSKKSLAKLPIHRVVFHEITKTAIQEAINNPRDISMDLVNAQQARRALDYLVGFTLSPLLWRKIRTGLSAGRVQSPALRLIVEREIEIEAFQAQEYWSIAAQLDTQKQQFPARLVRYNNEKVEQFTVTNKDQAEAIRDKLLTEAQGQLLIAEVEKKQRKRNPAAPFITSTLQQDSIRKIGLSAERTMRTAQALYEAGFITYMRTDSVNLAQEAITNIRSLIEERYGKDNLPDKPRVFKTKSKNAQEAHEAVRPTDITQLPEQLKEQLTTEQFKLYDLIWKRTVASQMQHATMNIVSVTFNCGSEKNQFRATGSTITHPGFLAVYQEGLDDDQKSDGEERLLPPMKEGDKISLTDILNQQHFTEPPPRYSEATIVKSLEEFGIGRPSTYASIISTLISREYVILDQKRFKPTDVGRIVNKFLTQYFTQYVDYDFTAKLEDQLDNIARGEQEWTPVLEKFWHPFKEKVEETNKNVTRKDVTQEALEEKCPKCEAPLAIRLGKRGRFIGCSAFPNCDYTASLEKSDEPEVPPETVADRNCPECESALVIKAGRYGKFIGCSGYPKCRFIEPLVKPADTKVECPKCSKGSLLQRRSRRGKIFYSCSKYPDCDYALWNPPLKEACPKCNWPLLTLKTTKRRGNEKVCPVQECDFAEQIPEATDSTAPETE